MNLTRVQSIASTHIPVVALRVLGLGAAYGLLVWWGITQSTNGPSTFIWPASGFAIAALVASQRREWPMLLAALGLAGFSAQYYVFGWPLSAIVYMAGDLLEYWIGATLFLRATRGRIDFDLVRHVNALVGYVVGVSATLSALLGAAFGYLLFNREFWLELRAWWIANATGDLLVMPMILVWLSALRTNRVSRLGVFDVALILLALVVAMLVAHPSLIASGQRPPYLFVVVPLVVWVTFRGGQPMSTLAVFLIACISYWGVASRMDPLARTYGNLLEAALELQAFVAVFAASILYLGAAVAARERAAREAARLSAELSEARRFEAIGAVAGGVAHDFNNILVAVEGYADLAVEALEGGESRQETQRYFDSIHRAARRGRNLTNQIFTLTLPSVIDPRAVAVAPIVDEIIAFVTPDLPPGVTLRRTAEDSLAVAGDATQVHQIVLNLVNNAVKATARGRIEVTLSRESVRETRQAATGPLVPGDYVVIAVRDTGVGIEPTVVRRIFDPFFSAGRQGSGLELTIVARNVKGHGGAVEVDSAPGQGSTFRAYLPAATAAATGQPVFDAVYPSGDGDFVMLVDDDRSLLELGEEVIARLGYEPIGYADPFEALQAFSSDPRRFDLVIVDDGLPDINGLDLIRRMRAYRADIPAILVSSDQRESLIRQARDAGVFGPMFKPLRRGEVARGIAAALGRSAAGELHP